MPKRVYRIAPLWMVQCTQCNEDISEGTCFTRAEAVEARDVHEAWHKRDEAGE
jgi:hypothetical protein